MAGRWGTKTHKGEWRRRRRGHKGPQRKMQDRRWTSVDSNEFECEREKFLYRFTSTTIRKAEKMKRKSERTRTKEELHTELHTRGNNDTPLRLKYTKATCAREAIVKFQKGGLERGGHFRGAHFRGAHF
jgi:hypothetical protein